MSEELEGHNIRISTPAASHNGLWDVYMDDEYVTSYQKWHIARQFVIGVLGERGLRFEYAKNVVWGSYIKMCEYDSHWIHVEESSIKYNYDAQNSTDWERSL